MRYLRSPPKVKKRPLETLLRSNRHIEPCGDTLALILAGGRGTRLHPLTDTCCKPAIPFGGNFRLIDFSLSNCINSGIRRIGILSQYEQHSLLQHLNEGWNFLRRDLNEFIDLLPASQRLGPEWYQGTADAIAQNLHIIKAISPRFTLVLAGDHVYKADYRRMINNHLFSGAAVTVACVEVPRNSAHEFGVVRVDDRERIIEFEEKPAYPKGIPGRPDKALVSMGIYVFDSSLLAAKLESDANDLSSSHDFGRDILPRLIAEHNVHAYVFSDQQKQCYWRDVGTVDAYFAASMELLNPRPELDLNDKNWPVRCAPVQLPPMKFISSEDAMNARLSDSIIAAGSIVHGARVRQAILHSNVQINNAADIYKTVLLPGVKIGANCRIRNAIIDTNTHVPDGTVIGYDAMEDAARYSISENGIAIATANDCHRRSATVTKIRTNSPEDEASQPRRQEVT